MSLILKYFNHIKRSSERSKHYHAILFASIITSVALFIMLALNTDFFTDVYVRAEDSVPSGISATNNDGVNQRLKENLEISFDFFGSSSDILRRLGEESATFER